MKDQSAKDLQEILYTELIAITGGLFAGFLLASALDKVDVIPGLFILLPGLLEMRGAIIGSLAARLSSGLFLKYIKPDFKKMRVLNQNIIATFLLGLVVSSILGTVAFFLSYYIFDVYFPKIILIAIIASIVSNIIEIPLTIISVFRLFRQGYDPNNIMGPYMTTMVDIISILSLMFAIVVI